MNKLYRLLVCTVCIFLLSYSGAYAITDEEIITSAVSVLNVYGYQKNIDILNGNNYTNRKVRIEFKDLSELDYSYRNFFAITANDDCGNLYILINKNLRNSDEKALACLILHESIHCKNNLKDSFEEEIFAHSQEVILYNKILQDDKGIGHKTEDILIKRLNKLKSLYENNSLNSYIMGNANYINYLQKR